MVEYCIEKVEYCIHPSFSRIHVLESSYLCRLHEYAVMSVHNNLPVIFIVKCFVVSNMDLTLKLDAEQSTITEPITGLSCLIAILHWR